MSQFKYKFEKYDFKRFLLDEGGDKYRSEKFIFWHGRIPMPDDLIYKLFDDRGELVALYLNHILAMLFLTLKSEKSGGGYKALSDYPCSENHLEITKKELQQIYKKNLKKIRTIETDVCSLLLLDGFRFNEDSVMRCLEHQGKKYNRLFLPIQIRDSISKQFKGFDYNDFRSQSDMFGNIIADHYSIYRSGFGDALSGLFNKLIDFLIQGSEHYNDHVVNAPSSISLSVSETDADMKKVNFKHRDNYDGSIWEPAYIDNKIGYYFDIDGLSGGEGLSYLILQVLSELELTAFSEKERKKIEYLRKDLSRLVKEKRNV